MPVDGKVVSLRFNTFIVGGVIDITVSGGTVNEARHRSLCTGKDEYRPGSISSGTLSVELYRDVNDVGQSQMAASRQAGLIAPIEATLQNGVTYELEGYVTTMPLTANIGSTNRGTAQIRITSGMVQ